MGKSSPLPAHYCTQCKRYMMGSISYGLFIKAYGKFSNPVDGGMVGMQWDMMRESKLHSLGYKADEDSTATERQTLLKRLIDSKQITFFEVTSTIERDIRTFENHPNFINAIPRWRSDLQFINEWELNRIKKK